MVAQSGLYGVSGIQRQDEEVEQGGGHELQEERGGSGGTRGSSLRLRRLRWHLQVRGPLLLKTPVCSTSLESRIYPAPDPVFPLKKPLIKNK
jgi:hypothetical protein